VVASSGYATFNQTGFAMNDDQKERDDFENGFFYFVDALKVLGLDAEAQCEEMGDYNVPWELQHDISEGGLAIARSPAGYLTSEQTNKVLELSSALNDLPKEAIAPPGTLTTSHSGSLTAMNHAAWAPMRQMAAQLLQLLEPAIERNREYFSEEGGSQNG
jgi:hypothetical protein